MKKGAHLLFFTKLNLSNICYIFHIFHHLLSLAVNEYAWRGEEHFTDYRLGVFWMTGEPCFQPSVPNWWMVCMPVAAECCWNKAKKQLGSGGRFPTWWRAPERLCLLSIPKVWYWLWRKNLHPFLRPGLSDTDGLSRSFKPQLRAKGSVFSQGQDTQSWYLRKKLPEWLGVQLRKRSHPWLSARSVKTAYALKLTKMSETAYFEQNLNLNQTDHNIPNFRS